MLNGRTDESRGIGQQNSAGVQARRCEFTRWNFRELAARMMLRVNVLEAFAGDMRINLRGRNVAVSKEHLHHAKVRAVVQQMRGERVSQRVRR